MCIQDIYLVDFPTASNESLITKHFLIYLFIIIFCFINQKFKRINIKYVGIDPDWLIYNKSCEEIGEFDVKLI